MKKKKKMAGWKMDPDDVLFSPGHSMSRHYSPAKNSRGTPVYTLHARLRHRPTGIEVEAWSSPERNLTRKKKREIEGTLYAELWHKLENKVSTFLRIPGK